MNGHDLTNIHAMDELEEVAQVISCIGYAVGHVEFDEYNRGGIQTISNWASERLRKCRAMLGQAGSVPS
jgi:hypothetical protein